MHGIAFASQPLIISIYSSSIASPDLNDPLLSKVVPTSNGKSPIQNLTYSAAKRVLLEGETEGLAKYFFDYVDNSAPLKFTGNLLDRLVKWWFEIEEDNQLMHLRSSRARNLEIEGEDSLDESVDINFQGVEKRATFIPLLLPKIYKPQNITFEECYVNTVNYFPLQASLKNNLRDKVKFSLRFPWGCNSFYSYQTNCRVKHLDRYFSNSFITLLYKPSKSTHWSSVKEVAESTYLGKNYWEFSCISENHNLSEALIEELERDFEAFKSCNREMETTVAWAIPLGIGAIIVLMGIGFYGYYKVDLGETHYFGNKFNKKPAISLPVSTPYSNYGSTSLRKVTVE